MQEISEPPEDDTSIAAHLRALQRECAKSSPNSVIIAEKMLRTVSYRSQLVREKRVLDVVEEFPCLQMEEEVLHVDIIHAGQVWFMCHFVLLVAQ